MTALLARRTEKLAGGPQAGNIGLPPLAMVTGVGRQQQALRILFLLDTLSATWLLCLLNDSEVSRWTSKIFGHCTRGSCESLVSIFGWVLAWINQSLVWENNATDDFGAEINRELSFRYAVISSI